MEFYFILVFLGLVVGSFISALTYRVPKGIGFVTGRSFCDNCKKELKWYDNVPLFSFLVYKGKSRCCGKKISPRYPLIEIATALGLVFIWSLLHNIMFLFLFSLTLIILIIDLEHQFIPDELSWLILILVLFTVYNSALFISLFTGFFFSFLFLLLHIITRGRGMGLGDVKLAIGLGALLGWLNGWKWITTAFILGGIVSLILLVLNKANMKTKVPFGPFMIVAFWLVVLNLV